MPLLVNELIYYSINPLILFGIYGFIIVGMIIKQPETFNVKMKDQIEEFELADNA